MTSADSPGHGPSRSMTEVRKRGPVRVEDIVPALAAPFVGAFVGPGIGRLRRPTTIEDEGWCAL
jgi:hypothetical protein